MIWQPSPAMVFDGEGRRADDRFPIKLLNLASLVGRKVWRAGIKIAPAPTWFLVLSDQRPWAHGGALTRCAIALAADGAIEVIASSEDAIDEVVATLSGLSWWAIALGDPDPDASSRARAGCVSVLTRSDINRNDPSELAVHDALREVLTTISVGGHA